MSDSRRLHASCLSLLQSKLGDEDFRNLDTWAWAITGVLLQKTISWPAWSTVMPDPIDAFAREQRFRRWHDNPRIEVRRFYHPSLPRPWQTGQVTPPTLVWIRRVSLIVW